MLVVPFNVMGSAENLYDKDARWWSTPYERHNKFFTGFAHGALSGVGCPDMGSLLTMATTGPLTVDYKEYGTAYRDEKATPGYYSVTLDKYDILAEATATARTSAERYTFPSGKGHLLLNLGEGLTNESGAMVRRVSATEIEGTKLLGTFCYNPQKVFPVYFVLRVSKAPSSSGYWKKQRPMTGVEAEWTPDNGKYKLYTEYGREMAGDDVGYWFTFDDLREGEQVEVRMGISFVSTENARRNLDAEQPAGTSFDAIREATRARWNEDLGRIRVEGGTAAQQTVFYTALYHALLHPNLLSDVNGEYPLMERSGGGRRYRRRALYGLLAVGHLPQRAPAADAGLSRAATGHGALDGGHVAGVGLAAQVGVVRPRDLHDGGRPGDSRDCRQLDERSSGFRHRDGLRGDAQVCHDARGRRTPCVRTSTPISSGAISRWGSTRRTLRATFRCRMLWNTTWPTRRCRCWPTRWAKRRMPSCSGNAHWDTNITTARNSGLFALLLIKGAS